MWTWLPAFMLVAASLAITTYQAGFLVFVGRMADGRLAHHHMSS